MHIVTSGVTNMLLLWAKTNGDVKAIIGVSGLPFKLVTRNPNIKTIKDYGPTDRIALPTVRQSIQAITLGIALQKVYGDDKANEKLLPNQVQMGHPDALAALLNPAHEVTSHFASSPFQEIALKNPGIHVVLESSDALGGDGHVALAYGTTKFYQENPKTVHAFLAAYDEAVGMIKIEPEGGRRDLSLAWSRSARRSRRSQRSSFSRAPSTRPRRCAPWSTPSTWPRPVSSSRRRRAGRTTSSRCCMTATEAERRKVQ